VFVDFDGTLAPIVEDYESARPLPEAPTVLKSLADRYARVAVISGRPLSYLTHRLAGAGRTELIGVYGFERSDQPSAPEIERWRRVLEQEAEAAEAHAPDGVVVERKGLALTLHYRAAPRHRGWVEDFVRAAPDLVAHPGKMSVELRPPVETDKGTVVAELSEGLNAVCFVGDDRGDLPAFASLARMADKETLTVAVDGPETPDELKAAAQLIVDGPQGALEFLRSL
jgi:trehalose 6-phosphate phosphatase